MGFPPEKTDPYRKMAGYEDFYVEKPQDWFVSNQFVPSGFVHKGHFTLFGPKQVFIFENRLDQFPLSRDMEAMKKRHGTILYSVPVKVVDVTQYFACAPTDFHVTIPPVQHLPLKVSLPTTDTTPLMVAIAINVFLAILIVLVVILYCLGCCNKNDEPKEGKSKRDKGQKKKSPSKEDKVDVSTKYSGATSRFSVQ